MNDLRGRQGQSVGSVQYILCLSVVFLCDFGVVMSVSQSARVSEIVPGESSLIAQFFFNPVRQEKNRQIGRDGHGLIIWEQEVTEKQLEDYNQQC